MTEHETDRYRHFIERLKREEQRPEALNEIKNLLTFKSGQTSTNVRDAGLSKIFHCLTAQDKIQLDLTCDVLKLCFEKYNVGDVIRNYTSHMMYLLRHDKECVRQLALDEVYKTVASDISLLPTQKYVDVFVAVAHLVTDTDISIANKAVLITSNLSSDAYPRVLEEMKIALEYTSSSKCNAFEVVINISSKSSELLNLCAENGYIDFMLTELHSTDVLYQMNILELFSRLVVTPHGIKHLVECGGLKKISELIAGLENNPLRGLLVPGYLKFFGCITRLYPREVFQNYPAMLNLLFHALQSDDPTVLIVALDTLGFIGATIEGKLSLAALGNPYNSAVANVGTLIKTGATEIKVRALQCFSSLIGHDRDLSEGTVDHRVILMSREWFRSLSSQPESMAVVHDICKNPFPDIKLAAFNLLNAVSQYRWGEELVAQSPGFIEFLLDRTIDYSKDIKESKYEIIKKLSRSASFDNNILIRLTKYVEEGPFYSESVLQVAMEEGD